MFDTGRGIADRTATLETIGRDAPPIQRERVSQGEFESIGEIASDQSAVRTLRPAVKRYEQVPGATAAARASNPLGGFKRGARIDIVKVLTACKDSGTICRVGDDGGHAPGFQQSRRDCLLTRANRVHLIAAAAFAALFALRTTRDFARFLKARTVGQKNGWARVAAWARLFVRVLPLAST